MSDFSSDWRASNKAKFKKKDQVTFDDETFRDPECTVITVLKEGKPIDTDGYPILVGCGKGSFYDIIKEANDRLEDKLNGKVEG